MQFEKSGFNVQIDAEQSFDDSYWHLLVASFGFQHCCYVG